MGNENGFYGSYSRLLEDSYAERLASAEAARKQSVAQAQKLANESMAQEYIRREQAKRDLPQQAALLGVGGITESSAIALDTAYGENRNSITNAKQAAISEINIKADREKAAELADYQRALLDWERERRATELERQRYQDEMDFKREQFEYQKEQDAYRREQEKYDRRQKELLAAQKAARTSAASKQTAPPKKLSLNLPYDYSNTANELKRLF